MKKTIGYAAGVFDLFHSGHVALLKSAHSMCDVLVVGLTTDNTVQEIKHKKPIFSYEHRKLILESCRYVDLVVPQDIYGYEDKLLAWKKIKFDMLFVGDDWFETEKWRVLEKKLNELECRLVYLPYTEEVSSTSVRERMALENNLFCPTD